MNRRTLRSFVAKLGAAKAAARFGVSERTLRGWVSRGVPSRRLAAVEQILARHARAVQAAKTRQRDEQWREREWQERIALPPKQRKGERLTDEQRAPRRDPEKDEKSGKFRDRLRRQRGWKEITDRWAGWELISSPFQLIQQDYYTFAASTDAWGEHLIQLWRKFDPSNPYLHDWTVWFHLHLLRYYPDNPAYRGKRGLAGKAGHWVPIGTVSSRGVRTEDEAQGLPSEVIHKQNMIDRGGPRQRTIGSIDDDAQTRNFYVFGYHLVLGRRRPDVTLEDIAGQGPRSPGEIVPRPRRRRRR